MAEEPTLERMDILTINFEIDSMSFMFRPCLSIDTFSLRDVEDCNYNVEEQQAVWKLKFGMDELTCIISGDGTVQISKARSFETAKRAAVKVLLLLQSRGIQTSMTSMESTEFDESIIYSKSHLLQDVHIERVAQSNDNVILGDGSKYAEIQFEEPHCLVRIYRDGKIWMRSEDLRSAEAALPLILDLNEVWNLGLMSENWFFEVWKEL